MAWPEAPVSSPPLVVVMKPVELYLTSWVFTQITEAVIPIVRMKAQTTVSTCLDVLLTHAA